MTAARFALVPALVLFAFAPASAQQPGVPGGIPSVGEEIDRALSQVPGSARGRAGAPSVGAEVDAMINGARAGRPASRQVAVAFANRTPHKALVVQFTQVGRPDWGANRLVNERFNAGASMRWRVNGPECRYDVRITFEEGNEFVRLDHDFCAQEKIEITAIDAPATAMPARDGVALYRVVNPTNQVVSVLRVTPSGAGRPGPDLLGEWVMMKGDHYTGRVARGGRCLYDIRVGFNPAETETATIARQNLCETSEIVIPARATTGG
jgi:hypothetical protein